MSLKKIVIILIVLLILVLILGGILFFFTSGEPIGRPTAPPGTPAVTPPLAPASPTAQPVAQPTTAEFTPPVFEFPQDAAAPSDEAMEKAKIKLLVQGFIEDYSSFSSNSGYTHIERQYDNMTAELRAAAIAWIESDPAVEHSPIFYSIQTKVAEVKFDAYTPTSARVILDTSRSETDAPEFYNRSFRQTVAVTLIKVQNAWQVKTVTWN